VDLGRLRAALPDNLYWRTGAPTRDPEVLRARDAEAREWNALFGRVQATEASREEVQRYYDYKQRVSEDSIAFAARVLQDHGGELPERDRGLLALSIRLHQSRLEDLPKERAEALTRLEARAAAGTARP
jgi:hypothetical protein